MSADELTPYLGSLKMHKFMSKNKDRRGLIKTLSRHHPCECLKKLKIVTKLGKRIAPRDGCLDEDFEATQLRICKIVHASVKLIIGNWVTRRAATVNQNECPFPLVYD
jgi:hypothetical protein